MSDLAARPARRGRAGSRAPSRPAAPPRGAAAGAAPRGAERVLVLFLAASAALAMAAAAFVLLPPALLVTRFELSGNVSMTRDELLSAALLHEREYFFSLDASRVEEALAAEPRIARAKVAKLFPNGLRIEVTEREAVASALVSVGGRTAVARIDAEGVAFALARPEEAASVPVLSGIRFEGFRAGTRLPQPLAALLASLGEIRASEPALLSSISEIRMVKGPSAADELLIYPLNQRIPVRAGASLDAPTLRSIILVLDVLGTRGVAAPVREIDFRTGTVVYRSKEGQSG